MTSFTRSKRPNRLCLKRSSKLRVPVTSCNELSSDSGSSTEMKPRANKVFQNAARSLFKIFSLQQQSTSRKCDSVQLRIPLANSLKSNVETLKFGIILEGQSLGVTLAGYCPCYIAKIEQDSIAAKKGLRVGDFIIRINGMNVSRAKCDSIVKIIRNFNENSITLDILRKNASVVINSTENNEYAHINQHKCSKLKTKSSRVATAKKSRSTKQTKAQVAYQQAKQKFNKRVVAETFDDSTYEEIIKSTSSSFMPSPIAHMSPLKTETPCFRKYSVTDSDYKTRSYQTESDLNCSEHSPKDELFCHMNACEAILNLEEKFIDSMQKGVQQYSRPLRHCMMISPMEHHSLFQNIEKILAISEYQLNQLISHDDSALFDMFNTIGKLYENKLRMSSEAFDIYLSGVSTSFDLLKTFSKKSDKQFSKFLVDSNDDINMDLKTFLLLPLFYVISIHKSLRTIRAKTDETNTDYEALSKLINNLDMYVEKANQFLAQHGAVNPFLADSDRSNDLINSGELKVKSSNLKWRSVKLNLYRNRLSFSHVADFSESAILLNKIISFDFGLAGHEFQFSHDTNGFVELVRFKAESLHEKLKWKCLFK